MKSRKNVLIIGFGSIANRYVKILRSKKYRIFIYQHRPDLHLPHFAQPISSLNSLENINSAIIASPTASHLDYALSLIRKKIPILIEKPLSEAVDKKLRAFRQEVKKGHTFAMVGFNFRYLPVMQKIEEVLKKKLIGDILFAKLYVGQYLPSWRPKTAYDKTYSASFSSGGGVALDLIHEIDLALAWFGKLKPTQIVSRKFSKLKIDCEDFVRISVMGKPFIEITLDYLNWIKTRQYLIVGSRGTIYCDLYNHYFMIRSKDKKDLVLTGAKYFDVDQTFIAQVDAFFSAIAKGKIDFSDRSLGIDALQIATQARSHVSQ